MRFTKSLAVAFGGVCGAGVRWILQTKFSLSSYGQIPWMILSINVTGCCFLGILLGKKVTQKIYLLLGVGFCGGMTTFSTFAVDTASLMKDSQLNEALIYASISIIGGLLFFLVGRETSKRWL
tara:strand:+ start:2735 stop:3103 length:369 start_codon:yes stop_codon:yes gene_type:complete